MPLIRSVGLRGGGSASGSTGGPDGTAYYVEITIDHTLSPTTLTDFPVYVDLSLLPAAFWSHVESDGRSIRIADSTGVVLMPRDLVSIDIGAQTGELHFLASQVSSTADSAYRIYYGNASATQPLATDTYGRNAVWSAYAAVYHGDDLVDSTGNGNMLTTHGSATSGSMTAKIGSSFGLSGVAGSYLSAVDSASLDLSGPYTLSAWVRRTADPGEGGIGAFIAKWDLASLRAYILQYQTGTQSAFSQDGGFPPASQVNAGTFPLSTWVHVATTVAPSSGASGIAIFHDGVAQSVSTAYDTATSVFDSSAPVTLGDLLNGGASQGRQMQGSLDEVRIADFLASADWLSVEHLNQNTPGTLYGVGTEQAA